MTPAPGPRKLPQQERSRLMVERILDAAEEVLLTEGHDAASTNRIARHAGISPGSLYQYFGDKEALVSAVVERYSEGLSGQIAASFTNHLGERGAPMVRSSVVALLDALEANAAFLRVVVEGLPSLQHRHRLTALEDRVTDLVAAYLSGQRGMRDVAPPAAAWLLVRAIEQLTVRYVLDRPDIAREEFVSELVQLVLGYLGSEPT